MLPAMSSPLPLMAFAIRDAMISLFFMVVAVCCFFSLLSPAAMPPCFHFIPIDIFAAIIFIRDYFRFDAFDMSVSSCCHFDICRFFCLSSRRFLCHDTMLPLKLSTVYAQRHHHAHYYYRVTPYAEAYEPPCRHYAAALARRHGVFCRDGVSPRFDMLPPRRHARYTTAPPLR